MATRKVTTKQTVNPFADRVDRFFLAGLGIVANVRKAGTVTYAGLVKDGEKFRKETAKRAEKMMDRVEDSIKDAGDEAEERVEGFVTRIRRSPELGKIEKAFDKGVADTMDWLNVPSKNDIDMLNKKLNRIIRVVDAKEKKAAPKKATASKAPVARKKTAVAKAAPTAKTTTSKAA